MAPPTLTQSPDPVLDLHVPIHAPFPGLALDLVPDHVPDHVLVPTLHTLEGAEVVAAVIVLDPVHHHTIGLEHALLPIEGVMEEERVEALIDLVLGHQFIGLTVLARNHSQLLRLKTANSEEDTERFPHMMPKLTMAERLIKATPTKGKGIESGRESTESGMRSISKITRAHKVVR